MSEVEKQKLNIITQIKHLCAHCANNTQHQCRLQNVTQEIISLSGVPLLVNNQFHGLLFTK